MISPRTLKGEGNDQCDTSAAVTGIADLISCGVLSACDLDAIMVGAGHLSYALVDSYIEQRAATDRGASRQPPPGLQVLGVPELAREIVERICGCQYHDGGHTELISATTDKVRWGVLGVAKIATEKVIPAMQRGERSAITAIASRDISRAEEAAQRLGIPKAYGSYEELLADPEIEAVYNPLPNHLHVAWSVKAAEAGKHVLCEKPISLTVADARELVAARDRTRVKIQEAFMVRTHPQWLAALEVARSGRLGHVRAIQGIFSYSNLDPENIRNILEFGGGGLMDIGCYPITTSRFIFDEEPRRVLGLVERDPAMKIDRLASAILDFPSGQAIFTCSTQLVAYQRLHIYGTDGRVEIEIPFNAPPDRPCRIFIDDGSDLFGGGIEIRELPTCDQYTIQGDLFSRAVREDSEVPIPLEDAVNNMAVIEAIFRSAETGRWEQPEG